MVFLRYLAVFVLQLLQLYINQGKATTSETFTGNYWQPEFQGAGDLNVEISPLTKLVETNDSVSKIVKFDHHGTEHNVKVHFGIDQDCQLRLKLEIVDYGIMDVGSTACQSGSETGKPLTRSMCLELYDPEIAKSFQFCYCLLQHATGSVRSDGCRVGTLQAQKRRWAGRFKNSRQQSIPFEVCADRCATTNN